MVNQVSSKSNVRSVTIDPIEFGRVLARLDDQDRQIEEMRRDIKLLLDLANRGKGFLFLLTSLGAIFGAFAIEIMRYIRIR